MNRLYVMNRIVSSSIRKDPIKVTDNAWDKMSQILKKTSDTMFIFSADSGGCNGFNYKLETALTNKFKSPTIVQNQNVKIIIDPFTEMHLIGTEIDYIKEDYSNGIFENKFVFIPDKKYAYSCGCGKSFTVK